MFRGLYIAGTAMVGNTTAIDVVSNNLSNASTLTYKKDFITQESFNDILISKINGSSLKNNVSAKPIQSSESDGYYSVETKKGYFRVRNGEGVSHNTSLKFHVDEQGYLSTYYLNDNRMPIKGQGSRVQGTNGDIYIGDEAFTIGDTGEIQVGGQAKDNLLFSPNGQVIGTMNSGMRISQIITNFDQGDLETTDNPMDFCLLGKGFFEIETPLGARFTRNGSFKINANLELVTTEGYKVIGLDGPIVLQGDTFTINKFGEIIENGLITNRFKISNPINTENMRKIGQSMYKAVAELEEQPFEGEVIQGSLEGSNTSSISEMIQILQLYRNYEANQKIISSYDKSIEKLLTS